MSVLDFPIEKQHQMAAEEGLALEQWRAKLIASKKRADAFAAKLDADTTSIEDLAPDERDGAERFQARVDDEQLTHAVLSSPIREIPDRASHRE